MREPPGQLVNLPLLEMLGCWVVLLVVLGRVYGSSLISVVRDLQ